jgi:hypothetical protein
MERAPHVVWPGNVIDRGLGQAVVRCSRDRAAGLPDFGMHAFQGFPRLPGMR